MRIECEWGRQGASHLGRGADAIVVVDVLSFSTAVDIAVARGVTVFPYARRDETLAAFARSVDAEVGGSRGTSRYSLSPACYLDAHPGTRVVLPSVNGGAIVHSLSGGRVITGCLRNARAVAEDVDGAERVVVLPAGELWPDGSLRPAVEDWLGAGAIISHLNGTLSPEAATARAAFEAVQDNLEALLEDSFSGRELAHMGFAGDVVLAAKLDSSDTVPELVDGVFSPDSR